MTILRFNLLAPFCRGKHVSKQNKVTFLELFSSSPSSWWLKQLATWFVWIIYLVLFKRTHFKKKRAHKNKKLDPNLPAKKSWRDFKCPTIPILNRKNTTIPGDHYRSSKVSQGVPPKIHQVIARFFICQSKDLQNLSRCTPCCGTKLGWFGTTSELGLKQPTSLFHHLAATWWPFFERSENRDL